LWLVNIHLSKFLSVFFIVFFQKWSPPGFHFC
jgi:hypothetical protein